MSEPAKDIHDREVVRLHDEHNGRRWSDAGVIASATAVFVVATAVQCHLFIAQHGEHGRWFPSFLYGGLLWIWWGAFSLLLWRIGGRWDGLWRVSWLNVTLQVGAGTLLALGHLLLLQTAIEQMIGRWPYLRNAGYSSLAVLGLERICLEVLLYVIAWMACAAVHSQMARQAESVHTAKLREELSKAHLRALQMQLEPHFLLNTLNSITALVEDKNHEEASEMLSHLNAILKSTLIREAPEKVSLAKELAVTEHYLAIEQIRFADRLRIELAVDPRALDSMVPCFLLQPIIENAVRHGIAPLKTGGVICATIERKGEMVHLTVRDNGPGSSSKAHSGYGIGLRNTEGRLRHLYANDYRFSSGDIEAGGFEVSILIPYEKATV
jgi:sensor histidine kinase YesM